MAGASGNLKKEKVHQVGYMRHEQMACWKVDFSESSAHSHRTA